MRVDVESNVNACRRFFFLEVESRIVAACLRELGIDEFDDTTSVLKVSDDNTWRDQHEKFISARQHGDVRASQQRTDMTAEGRYRFRYPGCKSTSASSGQCRRNHEAKHSPPVNVPEDNSTVSLFFKDGK